MVKIAIVTSLEIMYFFKNYTRGNFNSNMLKFFLKVKWI